VPPVPGAAPAPPPQPAPAPPPVAVDDAYETLVSVENRVQLGRFSAALRVPSDSRVAALNAGPFTPIGPHTLLHVLEFLDGPSLARFQLATRFAKGPGAVSSVCFFHPPQTSRARARFGSG